MNAFYRFLRCAALMALMMSWMMPAKAQHPFTLTTPDDVTNHTETLYWIESKGATGFYMIPKENGEDKEVSTSNMPNEMMLWYFMDAGIESNIQYYYIVNKSTGKYLRLKGNNGADGSIGIKTYVDNDNTYKFSISNGNYQWVIQPYSSSSHYVNKKGTSVNYNNGLKSSTADGSDPGSNWKFVAKNSVTWAHPFTNSTTSEKNYYLIHNATPNGSVFYMSIDNDSDPYATISYVNNNQRIWYFMEAGSDNTIPNLKYYYIVNAVTGKYLYFTGTADGSAQANSLRLYEHDGNETGETENRFQFMVLNAIGNTYSAYSIMPKLEISYYNNKNTSLSPSNSYSNSLSNDMKIGIYNDRGQNNNYAHWLFESTVYFPVEAPTITNNDGTISLSTTTTGATIYYTTDGSTPDNTSTEYLSAFPLGNATVIKAIAYHNYDYSDVSIYNVPTCNKPTISYNYNTSKVTITCTDATDIYYTIDGSTPTTSSNAYSNPFTVSTGVTIKAIATHPGYHDSDVAIKYIQSNDYSQNYLTFNVLTAGEIPWDSIGTEMARTISYRINGGTWASITAGSSTISVVAGDVVEFKGTNSAYSKDKFNYSGFYEGTATYNVEGNIMSLIYGDDFYGQTTLQDPWALANVFNHSKVISAENLIMPATTLTEYCYRATFANCSSLTTAPQLPAETLANGCYYYMFDNCIKLTTAPDLLAPTLVKECYLGMFHGCSNLNCIICLATSGFNTTTPLKDWTGDVASSGTFVKKSNITWQSGSSGIPTDWIVYDDFLLYDPDISCDGEYITITCATEGASIYYRLNQTGDFSSYSSPIVFNSDTTVEAYSHKNNNTSNTVIITFEKYDNPYDESNRSLDSWTYDGNQVTLPYSVNAIDGHSLSYAKGTFNFETDVNLRCEQPTYLWFQHADQSASIYVDNNLVEKHWGGYNAFFVDISSFVHAGTNNIKVALKNNEGNYLAPAAGDFNFNATLGNVKLFTSPYLPSMDYGYDGFHITSTVSSASATINVKTTIPTGATVVCTINGENCNYTATESSTGSEMTFTTTITNPRLWNGTIDPYLYNIKLDIYKDNELYHRYERPYGLRFYAYNTSTGFILNGQPYSLRGVCMHHDLEGKANALTDSDIANDFAIIQELGCNFIRLAHYPHPKEVYDWCDQLGIIVQTEVPCVNKMQSTMPADYYTHLEGQYTDMVNQHYNHPCIIFWGLSNETTTNDKDFAKEKIEGYASLIKSLDPSRWVGYVMSHGIDNPSGYYNDPSGVDWFGCNIYVGWYIDQNSNNPTGRLNTRLNNTLARLNKPLAFSEYGGGGTQHCHSDDFMSTTTRGNNPRHDIEYQMWLHEGHIAAIKSKPELLFTSQWQLFDIAVSSRREGYTISLDGENTYEDDNLKYLNNKGLVERDHRTKKDPFYLYKAWWNQEDKFVHICGKDYEKLTGRAIKCYTNDGDELTLFVNNEEIETVSVENNIATFTARNFNPGDVIRVDGATTDDTFTFTDYSEEYVFTTNGNWNKATNWTPTGPGAAHNVTINASCTIPATYTAQANNITIGENGSLTIADGGQLVSNSAVNATVEKNITAYTVSQNQGEEFTNGWYFIASPITDDYTPTGSMVENTYDLYRLNNTTWENYKQSGDHYHFNLESGRGYLYANSEDITLQFTGTLKPYAASESVNVSTGWNLIGNPFAYNVYANRAFYKMNDDKTGIEAVSAFSTSPIAPCTGIVVEAETDGDVIFSKEAPAQSQGSNGSLQIALKKANARNNALLDNAIVSFNEDGQLGKFYFGTQNANIYIPQNGKEYAIAFSNCQDDIPLNFKTAETGIYTISFEGEEMCLNSIYLIDMLTGQEIDLSFNPSYTFLGSAADRSERFKIVFKTGFENAPSDIFAYQNGNDIVVSGEGELQIFDVMGRLVSTHHISGVERFNVKTQGVYIFKLNDKTQKIVIR